MSESITVAIASAAEARARFDEICELYVAVFCAPPFTWPGDEPARQRRMLGRLLGDDSFALALALDGEELAGFAYGVGLGADTRWWQGFVDPIPEASVLQEWQGRTWSVIDVAVGQRWRRRGVGRGLVETLLDGRSEDRATLAVQPQAGDSTAFWAALGGWDKLGQQYVPDAGYTADRFDIYVRALKP
ncbi:GNAT family N-acetyltransferase [Nocardia sp. alder85J]|uniref:GNAT family N-acetyltransferase n=1 Tax=Nocardia sp. alder85J TaxID=2862949 RepID=UPI001CD4EAE9|nr:GNAT family N-acetyltransferase [Nocardia sp. alder85J]MCX4094581.1 GNAT family N-acetyltransferase [Nocardia sp. alder85J]